MNRLIGITLALSGIVLSVLLLQAHVKMGGDAHQTAAPLGLCGGAGECDRVLESRWAWFPPIEVQGADEPASSSVIPGYAAKPAGEGHRIPVALIGLFYFTALLCWFVMNGSVSHKWRWGVRGVCVVGVLGSVMFLTLMLVVIRAVCPFCMAIHVVNFSILGIVWCRSNRSAGVERVKSGTTRAQVSLGKSLGLSRFAIVGCTLVVAIWIAEGMAYHSSKLQRENEAMEVVLNAIQSDVDAMDLIYFAQPQFKVPVRDDSRSGLNAIEFDATIAASDGYRNTVVVFGDVECGSCKRFHEFLLDTVAPRYEGHLRVVYKHLPHDDLHPNSRIGAKALEAARQQGKFWEFLDELYRNQSALHSFDYAATAEHLELDVSSFNATMTSHQTSRRVAEDEALAKTLNVTGTPAVFLNGRRVDKQLLRLPGFWNGQIERLKLSRASAGQGWGGNRADSTMAQGGSSE